MPDTMTVKPQTTWVTADLSAAATERLIRTGNADLLEILGLVDEPEPVGENGRRLCELCGNQLPDPIANGGHKPCRRQVCVKARQEADAQ